MTSLTTQVLAKAHAFADALCKLPRRQYAVIPSGHFGRDYNALRALAIEALPDIDPRLLPPSIVVRSGPTGRDLCEASYVEIETYACEIMRQLAATVAESNPSMARQYDTQLDYTARLVSLRQEHPQAYTPWSKQDDSHLRFRFHEGATIEDLAQEFGRNPGGIRSRLSKLGLDPLAVLMPSQT